MSRTVPNTDGEIGRRGDADLLSETKSMSNEDITDENTVGTNPDESNDEPDLEAELEDEYEAEQKKKEMMERKVSDFEVEGWQVKSEEGDRTIMMKPNYGSLGGHLIIAALTVWWTLGIGNALYAGYKYWTDSDKKVVRV